MKLGTVLFLAAATMARAINYVGDHVIAPPFNTPNGANLIGNVTLSAPGVYTAAGWNIVGNVRLAAPGEYKLVATRGGINLTGQLISVHGPSTVRVSYRHGLSIVVGSSAHNVTVIDDARGGAVPDCPLRPPPAAPLMNVSARATLAAGGALIPGFVVGGPLPRRVLVRAVGPGLTPLGVANTLVNPTVAVYRGAELVTDNDDWAGAEHLQATFATVGAFALDQTSRDAAVLVTLQPGAYTAVVRAKDSADTGEVLVEVYFVD